LRAQLLQLVQMGSYFLNTNVRLSLKRTESKQSNTEDILHLYDDII